MKSLRLLFVLLSPLLFFACSKEKSFEVPTGSAFNSQWEFTEGANQFRGRVDTAILGTISGIDGLLIEGTSDDGTGLLTIAVLGINPSAPGVYKNPSVVFDYSKSSGTVYENDIAAVGDFTVEITKIDTVGVTGVFYGKVVDSNGNAKTIASGKFAAKFAKAIVQPGSAQVVFWAKNSCGTGNDITVTLSNTQTGTITSYSQNAPTSCNVAGPAAFSVAPGTYGWKAKCGTDSVIGVITVAANQCVKQEVIIGSAPPPGPNGQVTFWAKASCSPGTHIFVTLNNVTDTITAVSATAPANCTGAGTANFSVAPGTYTWSAVCGSGTPVTGTVVVTSNQCSKVEVNTSGGGSPTLNTWSFTQGARTFSGQFGFGGDFGVDALGTGKALELNGDIPNTDTAIFIYIQFPASATAPVPGSYVTNPDLDSDSLTDLYFYDFDDDIFYVKDFPPLPPTTPTLTFVVTSYDATTKVVKGTFSGTAWNTAGNIVPITNGKFEASVNF